MGGTMRLGADPVKLHDGTRIRELYGEAVVYERHRHRYEVNNHLRRRLESAGLVCSGTSPDERLVEAIELPPTHPFFVASQFHPEFKSRPERPGAAVPRVRRRRARRTPGVAARRRRRAAAVRRRTAASKRSPQPHVRRARRAPSASGCTRRSPRCAGSRARPGTSARCADWRRPRSCARMGLEVDEDDAGAGGRLRRRQPAGADPGRGAAQRSILLCAHLDTVPLAAPVEPVLVDGGWENANDGDPRRRQQGRGRGHARAGAAADVGAASRRRSGVELLFTVCEEIVAARAKAFDVVAAAQRVRLRVRPRHADRRGRRRLADPLPDRRRAPRPRRARRRAAPRRAAARSPPPRSAIAAMRARPARRRDDRQRRHDRGRHARSTSSPSAAAIEAEVRSLDEDARRAVATEIDRPPPGRRRRRRVRPRRRRRADVPRLPGQAAARRSWRSPSGRCAPAATSRGRSSPAAASDANSFEAAGFACTYLANGTERNHEPGERVSVAGARGDARRRASRWSTRPPRSSDAVARVSGFEPIGSEVKWHGAIITAGVEHFRYADGAVVTRDKVWHPGRGRDPRGRRRARVADPPAARGGGHDRLAGDPGRQARRPRRAAAGMRPARAGRGDRQARRRAGEELNGLLHQPGLQRRAHVAVPGHRAVRRRRRRRRSPTRTSGSRSSPGRWTGSRRRSRSARTRSR